MLVKPGFWSAVWSFLEDESGGAIMEFALIAAIVLVMLGLLLLAIFRIGFPGV